MEIPFQPFDSADWMMFSGAEGSPEIANMQLFLEGNPLPAQIIVDDNGINILYWQNDIVHDFNFFLLVEGRGRDTKEMAKHLLTLIDLSAPGITIEDLTLLGFTYNKVGA